jgi:hypothetical protein
MSFAVKYSADELRFISDMCARRSAPRNIAHAANDLFHCGRPIRTERSIEFAVAKQGLSGRRFTRLCAVCGGEFKTSWPQARYCGDACKAVVEREYATRTYQLGPVQRQTARLRQRFDERWRLILHRFGNKCGRCGNRFPRVVYDLHHPNGKGSRKETPSKIVRQGTDEQFYAMMQVTTLLCANCHRITHAEIGNWAPGRKDA